VDLEGHQADDKVRKALELLNEQCLFLKVLGSYPAAKEKGNE
jgi:prephenate dehydratase